jgi:hypothetical protein
MSNEEIKGLLLRGKDVKYQGFLIRNYSLDEIFDESFGLDKYYFLISFANLEVKDIPKDSKVKIDKILYDIIYEKLDLREWFLEILNTFTYLHWQVGTLQFKDFIAYDENKKRYRMTEDKFDGFMNIFKKMYSINRSKLESTVNIDPNLAMDEETRKLAEEFAEFEKENESKNKNGNITLMGIISGVCSKGRGYTFFNIWDLKMYQLMGLYYGIEKDENYGYIMGSIYAGVWDTKKNKLNMEDIHWATEKLSD